MFDQLKCQKNISSFNVIIVHPISLHFAHISEHWSPNFRHVHEALHTIFHLHETKFNKLGCTTALVYLWGHRTGSSILWRYFHPQSVRLQFHAHSSYLMNSFIFIHKLDFWWQDFSWQDEPWNNTSPFNVDDTLHRRWHPSSLMKGKPTKKEHTTSYSLL